MPVGTLPDIRTQNAAGAQAQVLVLNHTHIPHTLAHVWHGCSGYECEHGVTLLLWLMHAQVNCYEHLLLCGQV